MGGYPAPPAARMTSSQSYLPVFAEVADRRQGRRRRAARRARSASTATRSPCRRAVTLVGPLQYLLRLRGVRAAVRAAVEPGDAALLQVRPPRNWRAAAPVPAPPWDAVRARGRWRSLRRVRTRGPAPPAAPVAARVVHRQAALPVPHRRRRRLRHRRALQSRYPPRRRGRRHRLPSPARRPGVRRPAADALAQGRRAARVRRLARNAVQGDRHRSSRRCRCWCRPARGAPRAPRRRTLPPDLERLVRQRRLGERVAFAGAVPPGAAVRLFLRQRRPVRAAVADRGCPRR